MKMRVYLKGGAVFTVEVTEFSLKRDALDGSLTELNWRWKGDTPTKLSYINLAEVAAIIREDV